ncbi:hypothetical protein [Salinimicrobium soli]
MKTNRKLNLAEFFSDNSIINWNWLFSRSSVIFTATVSFGFVIFLCWLLS